MRRYLCLFFSEMTMITRFRDMSESLVIKNAVLVLPCQPRSLPLRRLISPTRRDNRGVIRQHPELDVFASFASFYILLVTTPQKE